MCGRRKGAWSARGVARWLGLGRRFEHLHEERLDGRVADQFEEEEVLEALEADGAQGGQTQQQFGEAARLLGVRHARRLVQGLVDLLAQLFHLRHRLQTLGVCGRAKQISQLLA